MIEICLNTFAKQEGPYQDRRSLEELEDDLRDLLIKKGFKDFSIEDSYTGNSVREMPKIEESGIEQEELDASERPVAQAKVEEGTAYCDKCGKPFNPKDAVKIPYYEYPGASVSTKRFHHVVEQGSAIGQKRKTTSTNANTAMRNSKRAKPYTTNTAVR